MGSAHLERRVHGENPLSDAIPYPELTHAQTHPDRLAVAGRLLGLHPASVESCRFLELGCGPALNLAAMAYDLPGSRFVGVDMSAAHVARARQFIASADLGNVDVVAEDLRTFDPGPEPFDYIVAHGVYSWVEPDVREALLRVIGRTLAPSGLALVSYNTYPGWLPLRAVREMLLFHVRSETDGAARVRKSAELLAFLTEYADPRDAAYAATLARFQTALEGRADFLESERIASILHDELWLVNEPVYFHDFMARAQAHGLQFAAEADLRGATAAGLPPALVDALRRFASDRVSHEQYLDFLSNRMFRQTLLCRGDVQLSRRLAPGRDAMRQFFVFTGMTPPGNPEAVTTPGALRVTAGGAEVVTDHMLSKTALTILAAAAPRSLSWDALVEEAAASAGGRPDAPDDLDRLSATLLQAFFASQSLVGLATLPDRFTTRMSDRPAVAPLVRLLASEGQPRVPNRRHQRVVLDHGALPIVALMDGSRTIADLRILYDRHDRSLEVLHGMLAQSALLEA